MRHTCSSASLRPAAGAHRRRSSALHGAGTRAGAPEQHELHGHGAVSRAVRLEPAGQEVLRRTAAGLGGALQLWPRTAHARGGRARAPAARACPRPPTKRLRRAGRRPARQTAPPASWRTRRAGARPAHRAATRRRPRRAGGRRTRAAPRASTAAARPPAPAAPRGSRRAARCCRGVAACAHVCAAPGARVTKGSGPRLVVVEVLGGQLQALDEPNQVAHAEAVVLPAGPWQHGLPDRPQQLHRRGRQRLNCAPGGRSRASCWCQPHKMQTCAAAGVCASAAHAAGGKRAAPGGSAPGTCGGAAYPGA